MNYTLEKISKNINDKGNPDFNCLEMIDIFRNYPNIESKTLESAWKNIIDIKLKIDVIRLNQKGISLYIGKLKANELLLLATFDQWRDETLEGYQREKFKDKTSEIKKYLEFCPISIIPAILASFRESSYIAKTDDFGILEIPLRPGIISILDGQQRTGGFEEIYKEIKKLQTKHNLPNQDELINHYVDLLAFEVPIVFVDSQSIIEKMKKESHEQINIKSSELDGAFFFIINKTQKPVNPSLKDELAYKTIKAGITGIPIIEKEKWRTEIVPIVNELNKISSPFQGVINLGGSLRYGKPVPLFSFVSSLKPLFDNNHFKTLDFEQKKTYLLHYWRSIQDMIPAAFNSETQKEYLIFKTISIYALNFLSNDVYCWCLNEGINPLGTESIKKFIYPLKEFDWNKQTSPFSFLGGGKGVRKAHDILLNFLSEKGIIEATEQIQSGNKGFSNVN
jgi:DGQHR domain-containing protein